MPRLQLLIPRHFFTFSHLEQLSVTAEKSIRVAKLFRSPSVPERSLLPDLAYKDNKPRNRDRQRELIFLLEESNFDNKNLAENLIDKFFLAKENTLYSQNP